MEIAFAAEKFRLKFGSYPKTLDKVSGMFLENLPIDTWNNKKYQIKSGKIRKYVSDFPNPTTAGQDGCIVIPHLGASTEEAEDNCAKMAVKEMMNYLENGNIVNSVNYPNVDMGVCQTAGRVAICHKNIANMITKFTATFGDLGINIENMMNKSKGEYAYTMLDVAASVTDEIVEKLNAIEGVIKVRVVK